MFVTCVMGSLSRSVSVDQNDSLRILMSPLQDRVRKSLFFSNIYSVEVFGKVSLTVNLIWDCFINLNIFVIFV